MTSPVQPAFDWGSALVEADKARCLQIDIAGVTIAGAHALEVEVAPEPGPIARSTFLMDPEQLADLRRTVDERMVTLCEAGATLYRQQTMFDAEVRREIDRRIADGRLKVTKR